MYKAEVRDSSGPGKDTQVQGYAIHAHVYVQAYKLLIIQLHRVYSLQ